MKQKKTKSIHKLWHKVQNSQTIFLAAFDCPLVHLPHPSLQFTPTPIPQVFTIELGGEGQGV